MPAVAVRFAVIGTALFLVLFIVMWAPAWAGNDGWLFLYPVFLIAWLPVEGMTVLAIVSGIIGIVQSTRHHHRRGQIASWVATSWAMVLGLLSLPTLWFGIFPFFLFIPEYWSQVLQSS